MSFHEYIPINLHVVELQMLLLYKVSYQCHIGNMSDMKLHDKKVK